MKIALHFDFHEFVSWFLRDFHFFSLLLVIYSTYTKEKKKQLQSGLKRAGFDEWCIAGKMGENFIIFK
jgi:hypothetical protein